MSPREGFPDPQLMRYEEAHKLSDSPIGEVFRARHEVSGEWHLIKTLQKGLAEDPRFLAWYRAHLTIAGLLSEGADAPYLVGPMRQPDGEWFGLFDGQIAIARKWIGDPIQHTPDDWDLQRFSEIFGGRKNWSLVAVAVLDLIAATLSKLHTAEFTAPSFGQMAGAPHLNLKPGNVIISKDPRDNTFNVYLTDSTLALISKFAADHGVRVTCGYGHPEQIERPDCDFLAVDIFSCGLLLYRLLKGEDLVPKEIQHDRQRTAKWMRETLPYHLRNLGLPDAELDLSNILRRCLTLRREEQYRSIDELRSDLRPLLGKKNPKDVIAKCVGYARPEPDPWWKKLKTALRNSLRKSVKPLVWILVLAAAGVGGWLGYQLYLKWQCEKTIDDVNATLAEVQQLDPDCVHQIDLGKPQALIDRARNDCSDRLYDRAAARTDSARDLISAERDVLTKCGQVRDLDRRFVQAKEAKGACDGFSPLEGRFVGQAGQANLVLETRAIDAQRFRMIVEAAASVVKEIEELPCDSAISDSEPDWDSLVTEIDNWWSGLTNQECRDHVEQHVQRAKAACAQNRAQDAAVYRQRAETEATECQEAIQAVARAVTKFESANPDCNPAAYSDARDYLVAAQGFLHEGNFSSALFNARSAIGSAQRTLGCSESTQWDAAVTEKLNECQLELGDVPHERLKRYADALADCNCDEARSAYQAIVQWIDENRCRPDSCTPAMYEAWRLAIFEELGECSLEVSAVSSQFQDFADAVGADQCDKARLAYDHVINTVKSLCKTCDIDEVVMVLYPQGGLNNWNRARQCLESIGEEHDDFLLAQKYLVLVLGVLGEFGEQLREAFFNAVDQTITGFPTPDNFDCYAHMAWSFGRHLEGEEIEAAYVYYEKARLMPGQYEESPYEWRLDFIKCMFNYKRLLQTDDTQQFYLQALNACEEFLQEFTSGQAEAAYRHKIQQMYDHLQNY